MTARGVLVLSLGLLLVVALVVAGALLLREPAAPARVSAGPVTSLAPEARTPADLARAACVRVRLAAQGISADSAAETVRTQLAAARALAAEAVRGDGGWAPLSGGVAALDEAVRRDDGPAAEVGLRVALEECARFRS